MGKDRPPPPLDIVLVLPYPPSVNDYWHHDRRGHTYLAANGRAYRTDVLAAVLSGGRYRITGRLDVEVVLHPPDRRRRDLDNAMKSLLDSIQHAGVYEDDSQIDRLEIRRGDVVKGGKCLVRVKAIVDNMTTLG